MCIRDQHSSVASDLWDGGSVGGHDGRTAGHCLQWRQPETFVLGREDQHLGQAVDRRHVLIVYISGEVDALEIQAGKSLVRSYPAVIYSGPVSYTHLRA